MGANTSLADVEIGVTACDSDEGSVTGSQAGFSHWKREYGPLATGFNTAKPLTASYGPMASSLDSLGESQTTCLSGNLGSSSQANSCPQSDEANSRPQSDEE